jgi:UDP-N-acetylmuramoyl-L-alanyl-D-glutamate--2,6-diaminopimelate ligase
MNAALVDAEAPPGMRLDELVGRLPVRSVVLGDPTVRVRGVRHDSRSVVAGDLFVARKGQKFDAALFADDAVARGAAAVMMVIGAVASLPPRVPTVLVDDVAVALAHSAALVYGCPSEALEVVGITGTNGKTTTAYLVRAAIDAALDRASCGVMGTVGHAFDHWQSSTLHTTPEADDMARTMAHMRDLGATHVAMEVSSHAIDLRRVEAVRFRVAALTNLTQDHLDFHGSMEAYAHAKARLFTDLAPAAVVLNVDDAFGRQLAPSLRARVVRVSARSTGKDADVFPRTRHLSGGALEVTVATPAGDVTIASRLIGAHNLDNLLLSMGIVHALGLDVGRAAQGLSGAPAPPGRLERCDATGDAVSVLVDYAHTPDALARALQAVRELARGRVWCVFGCGGDRDSSKRAPMGEVAGRLADEVIVTSDNPRSEEPGVIAAAVAAGVRAAGASPSVELDRHKAIELAIGSASTGDVVLVAGKGHEAYQIVGQVKHPFDDRVVARHALAQRRQHRGA